MSPEPEKRSDDGGPIYGDPSEDAGDLVPSLLAALAASRADNERISAAWAEVIQREQRTNNAAAYDLDQARIANEQLQALVDQQLGECVGCNYNDGPDEYCPHHGRSYNDVLDVTERVITEARAERDAARVEVSQLRAKIDEMRRWVETFDCDCFGGNEYQDAERCDRCVMLRKLTALLAEPLGSTPDQPTTEENG